jgi:hypothetical protein
MQKWVQPRPRSSLLTGLAGLIHRLLGLEGGGVQEVVEHVLTLDQVVVVLFLRLFLLKKRNLSGVDLDHCFSAEVGCCWAEST